MPHLPFLPVRAYSRKLPFSTHPIPLTLRVRPVSANTAITASLHAPVPSRPTPSRPPEMDERISEGRNEGDEGEAEGWSVRMRRELEVKEERME